MWTERDQIQANQFLRRRLVSALASGDANSPTPPGRRLVLGTVMGVVAVLLLTAGFGIIGLLQPAGSIDWRQQGQVILEQGTGAHFVVSDGLLHPVINEASALLLAGSDKTITATASALSSAPRGVTLGIPGAPDSVPTAGSLLKPTLVTCSSAPSAQSAAAAPTTSVLLTGAGSAARALAGMGTLTASQGLLVQAPGSAPDLIAGGYRYQLPEAADVAALGYQNIPPLPVAQTWLGTLPAGRALSLVAVPAAGRPGPAVGGAATRVGQVLTATSALGGPAQYYLVRANGLELITQTEAVLVLGNTANASAYPGRAPVVLQASVAEVDSAPQHPAGADASGYPARIPKLADAGSGTAVVCVAGDGRDVASVAIGSSLPLPRGARAMPTGAKAGDGEAGDVYVPPGSGALVTAQAAPGARTTTTYLVTDEGIKFPLTNAAARRSLGYGTVKPVPVSTTLLDLLPTGPALGRAAAAASVAAGGGT